MNNSIVAVSLLVLMTGCVNEMRVHESIGPISGHLIRTITGPTDEGGGVRVSGIQTFSREAAVTRAVGGSSYCVRRKLCNGRVVTRRVSTPTVYREGGWKVQDSQFFAGPGTLQTGVNAAIGGASFVGGMYAGRPPKVSGDNISVTQQGGSATSTSEGGQGGQARAMGGRGGAGTGGAGGTGGPGGISVGGSAVVNSKSLNRQSQEFHAKNPLHPVSTKPVEQKPVYHKPVENKPVYQKPVEHKPVYHKPVEHKPVEHKPVHDSPKHDKH